MAPKITTIEQCARLIFNRKSRDSVVLIFVITDKIETSQARVLIFQKKPISRPKIASLVYYLSLLSYVIWRKNESLFLNVGYDFLVLKKPNEKTVHTRPNYMPKELKKSSKSMMKMSHYSWRLLYKMFTFRWKHRRNISSIINGLKITIDGFMRRWQWH